VLRIPAARYQDRIIQNPNKSDIEEIKMIFEDLSLISNDRAKQAAVDYYSLYESFAGKLMGVVQFSVA